MNLHQFDRDRKPRYTADNLRKTLELFDREIVKELLVSRCKASGLTPLALWLNRNMMLPNAGEVVDLLAEYSGGKDIEMLSPEGDLPLHVAVRFGTPKLVSKLISHRPDVLFRENATGRTPLELATDLYMQDIVSTPKLEPIYKDYQPGREDNNSILYNASHFYIHKSWDVAHEPQDRKRTYEVCVQAAQQRPAKRRLVSLLEANEVAKRVATHEPAPNRGGTRRGYRVRRREANNDSESAAEEAKDEVSSWLAHAF
jgi:hypothetical protein